MPTPVTLDPKLTRYLLGDLPADESRRIKEAMPFDRNLRWEVETTEDELIVLYAYGMLREDDRLMFETNFLSSEVRRRRLEFARAWLERRKSSFTDINSPLYRYVIGDTTPEEDEGLEEELVSDESLMGRREAVEDGVLIAYFQKTLPAREMELFEFNFHHRVSDIRKLRFADMMDEYVKQAFTVPSPTPENAVGGGRRRLENAYPPRGGRKRPGTTCARSGIRSKRARRIGSSSGHSSEKPP